MKAAVTVMVLCSTLLLACPVGAQNDNIQTVVLDYEDFGPQAASWELLGSKWWQWWPHGDSDPATRYVVKVVVYKDVPLDKVKERYPVWREENQDYRYVAYDTAIEYLDNQIAEDVLPEVTARLRKTRSRLDLNPEGKAQREFARAMGIEPTAVVSCRYWWLRRGTRAPELVGAMTGTFVEDGVEYGGIAEVAFCASAQPCVQKGRRLGKATSVVPRFQVDIQGPPTKINLDHFPDVGLINAPEKSAMPALVVRTMWENPEPPPDAVDRPRRLPAAYVAEERYVFLLSVAHGLQTTWLAQRIRTVSEDGRGFRMDTLQLRKGAGDVLDAYMTDQPVNHRRSRCRQPKPHARIWTFQEDRYREVKTKRPPSSGCR